MGKAVRDGLLYSTVPKAARQLWSLILKASDTEGLYLASQDEKALWH